MVKTIASILLTLGLIVGSSIYENYHVNKAFERFDGALRALYEKTESGEVTYEDGTAVERIWENNKKTLHIWLPHTSILEIDYQLYDAVGCLYVRDYQSALPKIEIVLAMCENIPQSYRFTFENIF